MAQWLECSVGDQEVVSLILIFTNLFELQYIAKNLRIMSSNPGHEDFLLYTYAFIFCI